MGREHGHFRVESLDLPLAIRTSRIFSKLDGVWRQVHHHGSMEDPQLLGRYQAAVFGAPSIAQPRHAADSLHSPLIADGVAPTSKERP